MTIRPKTIRRLLILSVACGVTGGVIAGAFYARRTAREAKVAADRELGFQAYTAGNFESALPALQSYIIARPHDVDAMYALGVSRQSIDSPTFDNLFEARTRYQQVLQAQPSHLDAKLRLLDIYQQTNLARELLAIADDVLASADVPETAQFSALRGRAVALSRLDRPSDAVIAWNAYLEKSPADFKAQIQLLDMLRRSGAEPAQVVAHARQQAKAHPGDARFELPLAAALREAGHEAEAAELLSRLARSAPQDPELILDLVTTLDRNRAFEEAERLLTRTADSLNSASLSAVLVQRMWLAGRHDQVLLTTERLLAAQTQRNPTLLALRALSLSATGRRDEAVVLVNEIRAMSANVSARAWADALTVEFSPEPLTPAQRVATLRDSLSRDGTNGIVYAWLARALVQVGEIDQAARCYREAAQRLPSWATPCIELSETMLAAGRIGDAVSAAKAGYLRAPTSSASLVQVARARFAELQGRSDAIGEAALLTDVKILRERLPDDASLLPIHIALLARQGRAAEADQLLRHALPEHATPTLFFDLYVASRRSGLDVSDLIFDEATRRELVTPQLAQAHAIDLASRRNPDAALAMISAQRQRHPKSAGWALVDARVRTALRHPTAASVWTQIVDAFPEDLAIQSAAIAEASEFISTPDRQAAIVERIRDLAGENSIELRLAQVRQLARSTNAEDLRQAAIIGSDLVRQSPGRTDFRVELARVLLRLDGAPTAAEHLRAAFEQSPGNAALGLELTQTLQLAGRNADVPAVLRRLATYDYDDAVTRFRVASALANAGLFDEVASLLNRAMRWQTLDASTSLLLAQVQSARGEDAGDLLKRLSSDPNAAAAALTTAAAYERRGGRLDAANALLVRAESASEPAAAKHAALARYAASFDETDAASRHYANAIDSSNVDATLIAEAANFESARHRNDRADAILRKGERTFPDNPEIKLARAELNARRTIGSEKNQALAALIEAMGSDASLKPQTAALQAVLESRLTNKTTPELAASLTELAMLYPHSIELSRQAITAQLEVGQPQAASNVAFRLLASTDNRVEAIELATRTLAQAGQYRAARSAATRWRKQVAGTPAALEADQVLAAIELQDGRPADAIALLLPHRSTFRWPESAPAIRTLVTAFVRNKAVDDGFAMITGDLATQPQARSLWLSIAIGQPDAVALDRLAQLEPTLPEEAADERIALAAAYLAIAERGESTEALTRGTAVLDTLSESEKQSPRVACLRGELLRAAGKTVDATSIFRTAIARSPDDARLKNALAYVLIGNPATAEEACRLATEAVTTDPKNAGYIDTLARAQASAGRLADAEASFRRAIAIDARSLDARIGMATLLSKQGKTEEALAALKQVDAQIEAINPRSTLPRHLRGELGQLRQAVSATSAD